MTELVIVEMHTTNIYDWVKDGETEAQALERASEFYKRDLALVQSHLKTYGGDYWASRVIEEQNKVNAGCKVMTFDDFIELQKRKLIDGQLKEITEDDYNEALNVLPPLYWTTINGVEMFCMREMYTSTYTTQYAKLGDKYYCTMVDVTDKSTWIHNLL